MIAVLLAPLPMLAVLALTFLTALPWERFAGDFGLLGASGSVAQAIATALALLPIAAIYFWSVRRPHLMPAIGVFAVGLALDVLTQGPLGVWPVAALVAALMGRQARRAEPGAAWARKALYLIAALAAAAALSGVLMSLYAWQAVPLVPLAAAAGAAILAYPLLAGLLQVLNRLWPPVPERSLFLRGD